MTTTMNAGIRWESIERDYESTIADRDETTFSASGGVSHDLSEIWNISGNLSYSERAPDYRRIVLGRGTPCYGKF